MIHFTMIGPTTTYEQLSVDQKERYYFSAKNAAQKGNFDLVQSLFNIHRNDLFLVFGEERYSLLHHACVSRVTICYCRDDSHVHQMVKKIIELGCPINMTDRKETLTPLEYAVTVNSPLSVTVMLFRMGGIFRPVNDEKYKRNLSLVKQNCMIRQEKQFKCGYILDNNCTLKVFPKEIIDVILLSSARLLRDEEELDVRYDLKIFS